jgi:hypothetical protein
VSASYRIVIFGYFLGAIRGRSEERRLSDEMTVRVTVDLLVYLCLLAQRFYCGKYVGPFSSNVLVASPEPTFHLIFQDSTQELVVVEEEVPGEVFPQAMPTICYKAEKVLPAATVPAFSLLFARLVRRF